MNYSTFSPSNDFDHIIVDAENKTITRRSDLIRDHVRDHNLIPLICDYFGMDSYYYDNDKKLLYKVCNVYDKYKDTSIVPIFEVSDDAHILTLNKLQKST
jgi:hypothetical protein